MIHLPNADKETIQGLCQRTGATVTWAAITDENTWLLQRDGRDIAVMGASEIWPGLAQAWTVIDREAVIGNGAWLTRQTRQLMHEVAWEFDYRQIRVMSLAHNDIRWTQLCGFVMEGVWLEAGPLREDVAIMVYHRRQS